MRSSWNSRSADPLSLSSNHHGSISRWKEWVAKKYFSGVASSLRAESQGRRASQRVGLSFSSSRRRRSAAECATCSGDKELFFDRRSGPTERGWWSHRLLHRLQGRDRLPDVLHDLGGRLDVDRA